MSAERAGEGWTTVVPRRAWRRGVYCIARQRVDLDERFTLFFKPDESTPAKPIGMYRGIDAFELAQQQGNANIARDAARGA